MTESLLQNISKEFQWAVECEEKPRSVNAEITAQIIASSSSSSSSSSSVCVSFREGGEVIVHYWLVQS
jgi:hypothetical protein